MARDAIILEGLTFYGYHGVHPEEQRLGQRFQVDLVAQCDLRPAGQSDRLADTVSYRALFDAVREVLEGPPHRLLESVAEAVAEQVLARFPLIVHVTVTVWKMSSPMPGHATGRVGVRVVRGRAKEEGHDADTATASSS